MYLETGIAGALQITPEPVYDERGHFCRIFDAEEFRAHGLDGDVCQSSVSYNSQAGTLRGMHFQASPHGESKLVRCTRGVLWDVIADVRTDSATHLQWWAVELSASAGSMLYVPEGVAHGFLTLAPDTEVTYQMAQPYVPASARAFRWDDPAFGIRWPAEPRIISERDRTRPDYVPEVRGS